MEQLLTKVVPILFFPFVFYPLWGPLVFFFVARNIVRRLRTRLGPLAAATCALVPLAFVFLPVVVAEPVGDAIPVILPWWVALLGLWLGSGLVSFDGSPVLAVLFIAVAACFTFFQAFRQRDPRNG